MAAGTSIQCYTGINAGTTIELSGGSINLRHKRADNTTADLNDPVPIPASGINYSWRKHTKLIITSAPSEEISNLRWYSQTKGGLSGWTGVTLFVGLTPTAGYTTGSAADESSLIPNSAAAESYLTGAPLTVVAGRLVDSADGFPTDAGSSETQDFIVQQMGVGSSASSGVTQARSVYYRYDEI
jgi:hypothetical protein